MLPGWEQRPKGRRSRSWWDLQGEKKERKEREKDKGVTWINDKVKEIVAYTWIWTIDKAVEQHILGVSGEWLFKEQKVWVDDMDDKQKWFI